MIILIWTIAHVQSRKEATWDDSIVRGATSSVDIGFRLFVHTNIRSEYLSSMPWNSWTHCFRPTGDDCERTCAHHRFLMASNGLCLEANTLLIDHSISVQNRHSFVWGAPVLFPWVVFEHWSVFLCRTRFLLGRIPYIVCISIFPNVGSNTQLSRRNQPFCECRRQKRNRNLDIYVQVDD